MTRGLGYGAVFCFCFCFLHLFFFSPFSTQPFLMHVLGAPPPPIEVRINNTYYPCLQVPN